VSFVLCEFRISLSPSSLPHPHLLHARSRFIYSPPSHVDMAIRRPQTIIPLRSVDVSELQQELENGQRISESRATTDREAADGDRELVRREEDERKRKEEQGRQERIGL
jgi:hypothetical protein